MSALVLKFEGRQQCVDYVLFPLAASKIWTLQATSQTISSSDQDCVGLIMWVFKVPPYGCAIEQGASLEVRHLRTGYSTRNSIGPRLQDVPWVLRAVRDFFAEDGRAKCSGIL